MATPSTTSYQEDAVDLRCALLAFLHDDLPAALDGQSYGAGDGAALQLSTEPSSSAPEQQQQPSKPRRKRGPTTQQQVAELERRVAEQTQVLQRLTVDNTQMSARVRMLELVIKVRDQQQQRVQEVQQGLKFNPFAAIGTTVEALSTCQPSFLATKYMELASTWAVKLSPMFAVLEEHPSLIVGPVPGVEWVALRDGTVPLPRGVEQGDEQGWATLGPLPVEPLVVQNIFHLCKALFQLQVVMSYAFFVRPQLMLMGNVHVHQVDPHEHASWNALTDMITKKMAAASLAEPSSSQQQDSATASTSQAAAGGAAPPQPPPTLAPLSHWRDVVRAMGLNGEQRLQAAALVSIVSRPLADLRRQRTQLAVAFEQLQPSCCPLTGGAAAALSTDDASARGSAALQQQRQHSTSGVGSSNGVARLSSTSSGRSEALSSAAAAAAARELPACTLSYKSPEALQQEEAILKRLQSNVAKEACLIILAAEVLFNHILSPVQVALGMVNSWPYMPDDLAILYAVAEEQPAA